MLPLVLAVLCASLLYYRLFLYKSRIQRMVAHIPGPKPLPIIGNMHYGFQKDEFLDTMKKLTKDYGSLFSLWFGPFYCAVITDPKDIEIIYKSNVELNKAFIYKKLLPWLGEGLLTVNSIDKWRQHRKILTPTFHFKILEEFMPVFNRNGEILVSVLCNKLLTDVNMLEHMNRLSFDVICETAMGVQFNTQLTGDSKFVKTSARVSELNTVRAFNLLYYVEWIFNMSTVGRETKQLTEYMNEFVDKVILDRQEMLDSRSTDMQLEEDNVGQRKLRTFLDLLLEYRKSGGMEFTDEEIRDEVNTFMLAGHDTTSITMSFFCHCVAQHPDIQDRLVEEQKSIFGSDSVQRVTSGHLSEMKYLEKTIKETLRLYPPAIFTMRSLNNDLALSKGTVIPAGGSIMILAVCAHLNPEIFPDPLQFNPDRFDSPLVSAQPFSFVPFSAGPRNCIGQRYAMQEIKVVLSHLLRNYKILPSSIPVKLEFTVLLKSSTGVHVQLEPRSF